MKAEDEITIFEVGKSIPIKVQDGAEGGQLELVYDLMFLLHFPNLRRIEKRIFEKGFKRYGYLELGGSVPLAIWIFDYPKPFGATEGVFNARLVPDDMMEEYLDTSDGVNNKLSSILLDGQIIKGLKVSGLNPRAVEMFHETIRKQLATSYSETDFMERLNVLYRTYDTYELLKMAHIFKHGKR